MVAHQSSNKAYLVGHPKLHARPSGGVSLLLLLLLLLQNTNMQCCAIACGLQAANLHLDSRVLQPELSLEPWNPGLLGSPEPWNPGMNPGMNPDMNPAMNLAMNPGMHPGMNPGMNPCAQVSRLQPWTPMPFVTGRPSSARYASPSVQRHNTSAWPLRCSSTRWEAYSGGGLGVTFFPT